MRKVCLAAALFLLVPLVAGATPITGYSTGSFTTPDGTTSYGTQLTWLGNSLSIATNDLAHTKYDFSGPVPSTGVVLAVLSWSNTLQADFDKDVVWNVNLYFTDPSQPSATQDGLSLDINAKKKDKAADVIEFEDLAGRVFTIPGYILTPHYYSPDGTFNSGNREWSSKAGDSSHLYLVADFASVPTPPASAPVPEPTSMVLLGTGLLGAARAWRRRP